jgi:hypothetical protein
MDYIEEGANGRIYSLGGAVVQKILKRNSVGHDILTQKRIHRLLESVISQLSCTHFLVPKLQDSYPSEYCMEMIDTRHPIYLGMLSKDEKYQEYLHEFSAIWKTMWYHGFALYDFELYLQRDGRIYMLDFDKTAFRMKDCPKLFSLPFEFKNQEYFFEHPCFPPSFLPTLLGTNHILSPRELFALLDKHPYHEENKKPSV